ncbi:hypothetical protein SBV1_260022 [Verrucomicrobia bacterium]|nr:hypothetical protein SBV1_260022 [Verrucomicrobiota bacterium]
MSISSLSGSEGLGWQRRGVGVNRGVGQARQQEGFTALDARAAGATVDGAAFVTGPGFREIHPELMTAPGYLGLRTVDERAEDFDVGVRSEADRIGNRPHEILTAVRVDGVVAGVGRDDESLGLDRFGKAAGDREHDPVPERDNSLLHLSLFVMALGNGAARFEQVGLEKLAHKIEWDDPVRNSQPLAVEGREGDFLVVVFGAVIEAERADDLVSCVGFVERGDRVHPTTDKDDDLLFHGKFSFAFAYGLGR